MEHPASPVRHAALGGVGGGEPGRRYGWVPDLPDQRDHLFAVPAATAVRLPASVDLRPKCPPVLAYQRVTQSLSQLKGALATGFPKIAQTFGPDGWGATSAQVTIRF